VKKICFALVQSFLIATAIAQSTGELAIDVERQRIKEVQRQQEIRYQNENSACYQKFAVSDCLNDVRARRRLTMEELRRQEMALNDLERKQSGADQLKRIEEKLSSEAFDAESQRRAEALKESAARAERIEQKNIERLKLEAQRSKSSPRVSEVINSSHSEEYRAAEKKNYEEKQRAMLESRARRERALQEREGKNIKPLPTQP
jgi:colicin import membrane protein